MLDMKKFKTAIIIVVTIIFFSILFYFFPPKKYIGRLPFLNRFYNNTTVEVVTQRGKAKVWIDGKDQGETPVTIEDLPEGKYLIEIEKIAPKYTFYKKHSFNIELSKNTSARIDVEIAPEDLLHGTILYYTPMRTLSKKGVLTVTTNSEESKVYIDNSFVNRSNLANIELGEGEHKIKIESDGYEEIELPVFVRENFQLNLKVYQLPIPISLDILSKGTNE